MPGEDRDVRIAGPEGEALARTVQSRQVKHEQRAGGGWTQRSRDSAGLRYERPGQTDNSRWVLV
jgi:hypothetical protein